VSEPIEAAPATAPPAPLFPEYGEGGDHAGARRVRRSFRVVVLAVVALTGALWFAESYLRYDSGETQYRMALTLHDDSARAVLRHVVKRDSEANELPNARYIEALAFIEEEDVVLERYQEAYRLNPSNPALLINYGCRLFQMGLYTEARERFREAGVIQPPRNALTRYLEAAALAAASKDDADLGEAMAIIARANQSGDPVIFPAPLWHSSLPNYSDWYAKRRRDTVDLCLAPLYVFERAVLTSARQDLDAGLIQDWDSWLEKLQGMGERLVGVGAEDRSLLGSAQAVAGIQMQVDALKLRHRIAEMSGAGSDNKAIAQIAKLESARKVLQDFENGRDTVQARHRAVLVFPFQLAGRAFGMAFVCFLLAYCLSRLVHTGRSTWVLPHSMLGRGMLLGSMLAFLILLQAASAIQGAGAAGATSLGTISTLTWLLLAVLLCFGVVYPAITLPPVGAVIARVGTATRVDLVRDQARRSRRSVYVSLMRRYYGICVGGLLVTLCCWVLMYRVTHGLYPWELHLSLTGLRGEELEAVLQVHGLLQ
jgi:tetratricopeptide (TPR) repeat protein